MRKKINAHIITIEKHVTKKLLHKNKRVEKYKFTIIHTSYSSNSKEKKYRKKCNFQQPKSSKFVGAFYGMC